MPELFREGILEMSTSPLLPSDGAQLWGHFLLNRIAVVAVVALMLIEISDLIRIFPQLLRCLSRWKGNVEVEHSVSVARMRNTITLPSVLAIAILANRFRLFNATFMAPVDPEWSLVVSVGIVLAVLFVRWIFYLCTPLRSRTNELALTLRHVIFNYLILLSVVMLVSALLLMALKVPSTAVRGVLLAECGLFYLLHLRRTSQILSSRYGSLATILYLCALEILPVGILIFVSTL
ncbi:MAG: DUF4271 domain-containing protein [Bacteroidales bacterium]|nr:DUF4271 domain-containing protein [Bacteroidales bacterium]